MTLNLPLLQGIDAQQLLDMHSDTRTGHWHSAEQNHQPPY